MQKIIGVVMEGDKRGTGLGHPTANIALAESNLSGIYAGHVYADGTIYGAALYADPNRKILEAHLFGFSGNLYGRTIEIEVGEKIREYMKFADDTQARDVISDDIARIRAALEHDKQS